VFSCDDRASYHEVGAVAFRTTEGRQTEYTLAVYGGDRPQDMGQLQTVTVKVGELRIRLPAPPYKPGMCIGYFRCGGRYLQIRVDNEQVNRDYGLYDLTVWVRNVEA
jgi:hypothetical protein